MSGARDDRITYRPSSRPRTLFGIGVRTRTRAGRPWVVITVATVVVLFGAATARLFIWPAVARPTRADAVVVLGGGQRERMARALELMEAGVAPTLVHVGQPTEPVAYEMCRNSSTQRFEVVCLRPTPVDNTRTGARAVARIAEQRGWKRLAVVTTTYHVTRSRVLFDRCFDGTIQMVGPHPPFRGLLLVKEIIQEWLASLHVVVIARDC